ncbi:MAG: ABC transporter permease subunit [Armatimonadia bacterium]|nr:ABC transporter permease subunit [Armatimonadia bacterium]
MPERTFATAPFLIGVALLTIAHAVAWTMYPDPGTLVVLWCVNVFALFLGVLYAGRMSTSRIAAYAVGYAVLFAVIVGVSHSPLLFAIFALLYAALFRNLKALGYLLILVFSVVFVPAYWFQTLILLSALYAVVLQVIPQRHHHFSVAMFAFGFILIAAVLLPLLYLAVQSSPQTLWVAAKQPEFLGALGNSFLTSTISTLVVLVFGVPLAYGLARLDFRGKDLINSLIDLPILIPQSVAGIAILVLLGPKAPAGELLQQYLGVEVSGSYLGIIACQIFVSCPFLIRSAMNAFEEMGPELENVSRSLGASPLATFRRVSLPLASGAVFSGAILTWARAISETGALMVMAYRPMTVPVYSYDVFTQYGLDEARPAAIVLLIVCLWAFVVLRWARGIWTRGVREGRQVA